jgi:hypothetical protein
MAFMPSVLFYFIFWVKSIYPFQSTIQVTMSSQTTKNRQKFPINWFVENFLQPIYKNDVFFKYVRNTCFFINTIKKACKKYILFK